jgi:membrane dipeptidase
MEEIGEIRQIIDTPSLNAHLDSWENSPDRMPIGYILSLEGADSILSMAHLELAHSYGLRAIGPAHYGYGIYANGTDSTGGMPVKGRELLNKMDELGMILDMTHLNDDCFWEALDLFAGPVWASHNNCRTFVNHNRQFSDEMILELINRDGVIGVPLDAWMMVPDWNRGKSDPREMDVTLEIMVDNIDHICQLAGDSLHAGVGSDLDGGFGNAQCPHDLDTIADLQNIIPLLQDKGYDRADIRNIMHGNFLGFLRNTWS